MTATAATHKRLCIKALSNDEMFEKAHVKAGRLITRGDYKALKKEYDTLGMPLDLNLEEYTDDDCIEKAAAVLAFLKLKRKKKSKSKFPRFKSRIHLKN